MRTTVLVLTAVTLALTATAAAAGVVPLAQWKDVPSNHWAAPALLDLSFQLSNKPPVAVLPLENLAPGWGPKEPILTGYGDGTFKGNKHIRRDEAVALFVKVWINRHTDGPRIALAPAPFEAVPEADTGNILASMRGVAGAANDVINTLPAATYGTGVPPVLPDQPNTAVYIPNIVIEDVPITDWAHPYVRFAYWHNLVPQLTKFRPGACVSRVELADLAVRVKGPAFYRAATTGAGGYPKGLFVVLAANVGVHDPRMPVPAWYGTSKGNEPYRAAIRYEAAAVADRLTY